MRLLETNVSLRNRLVLHLMDLSGWLTGAICHRGFYNLTRYIGMLSPQNSKVRLRLNADSVYELTIADPYWNRLIHDSFRYEPEIFHFFDLLKGRRFSFVDGGANWGFWSVLASSASYGSVETVAYEPMPKTFEFLQDNAKLNANRFSVEPFAIAGQAMSNVPMTASAEAELSAVGASLCDNMEARGDAIFVDALAIDDVLGRLQSGAPAVIKLDLEGLERSVIESCTWIDNNDSLLLYEDHGKDPTCEVTEAVLAKGWPIYFFYDDGRLKRIISKAEAAELKLISNRGYNFFAAHPGGVFESLFETKMNES
jgi:FkbM family methyltransferase